MLSLFQVLAMESMSLLRTGSGTSRASSAHAALCRWWAPASSPTATRFCVQTATTMTDHHQNKLHLQHLHTRNSKISNTADASRETYKTSALHMNTAISLIHSQCKADTKLSIYNLKSAFSTMKCLYKFCRNVL